MRISTFFLPFVLAYGLLGPFSLQAQCLFSDDYANPALWTQLNGGIAVQGGRVNYTTTSGSGSSSSQRGVFRRLPAALPDGGGWRADIDFTYGQAGSDGGCLQALCFAAGIQHPLNTYANGAYRRTQQDCIALMNTGTLGVRSPQPLFIFYSYNTILGQTWGQSPSLTLRENATSYLRLERLNATMVKLSAFIDAGRTQHQSGSPLCFTLPPTVSLTGLNTVWHANLPWGSGLRNDAASADNLCLSSIPVLDPALTLQTTTPPCLTTPATPISLSASANYQSVTWTLAGSAWTGSGNTVQFTPPAAGTYVFTAQGVLPEFCFQPATQTVTVVVRPRPMAALSYGPAPLCQTGFSPRPTVSPAGGTFAGSPGLMLNAATGVIDLATSPAGPHIVTYTSPGPCPGQVAVALTVQPVAPAALSYGSAPLCQTGLSAPATASPAGGRFAGTPGLVLDAVTGQLSLAASTAGPHIITYTSAGPCPGQATASVIIAPVPVAAVAYPSAVLCQAGSSPPPTVSPTGGRFVGTAGLNLNPITGTINLSASVAGPHVVTYTSPGPCPRQSTFALAIAPIAAPALSYGSGPFCQFGFSNPPTASPAGGTFTGTSGLVLNANTGIIDLATSTAGPHIITYTSAGPCPGQITIPLTVAPVPMASLSYGSGSFCQVGFSPNPVNVPTGGTYTAAPGLVMDARTGVLNLGQSQPGTYAVAYTSPGPCPQTTGTTVRVVPVPAVALAYDNATYCQAGSFPAPLASPPGGRYSGTAGLALDPATGVVDLANSTAGPHTVTYALAGQCPAQASTALFVTEVARPFLPNVITPNGDDRNDYLQFRLPAALTGYELRVFNRWGQPVYSSQDPTAYWRAEGQSAGIYYYLLRFADCAGQPQQLRNWVEVMR